MPEARISTTVTRIAYDVVMMEATHLAAPPPGFVAVVDDDEAMRGALARVLRVAEMDAEFLEALGSFGTEVHGHLQATGSTLPVILLTGHDSPAARARDADTKA
jgi:FixJ family two-component response regulator